MEFTRISNLRTFISPENSEFSIKKKIKWSLFLRPLKWCYWILLENWIEKDEIFHLKVLVRVLSIKIPSNNSNDPYSCWFQWGEGGGGNLLMILISITFDDICTCLILRGGNNNFVGFLRCSTTI